MDDHYAASRANHKYLSTAQLIVRVRRASETVRSMQYEVFSSDSKLVALARAPDETHRILQALSTGNYPQLRIIAARSVNKQANGGKTFIRLLAKAHGGWKPRKKKDDTDEVGIENDIGRIMFLTGGRRALDVYNKMHGGGSLSSHVRRQALDLTSAKGFVICSGKIRCLNPIDSEFLCSQIKSNFSIMQRILVNLQSAYKCTLNNKRRGFHVVMDNVALEERFRYSSRGLVGHGRESDFPSSFVVKNKTDFEFMVSEAKQGNLLKAKEATVVAVVSNSNPPKIVPVFISLTSKVQLLILFVWCLLYL